MTKSIKANLIASLTFLHSHGENMNGEWWEIILKALEELVNKLFPVITKKCYSQKVRVGFFQGHLDLDSIS